MPDAKYGRLFTEDDMRAILEVAHEHGWKAGEDDDCPEPSLTVKAAIERAEEEGHPLTFPADEPLFLLRAQDKAAPDAICVVPELSPGGEDYFTVARREGASHDFLERVVEAMATMRMWQTAHPDRVKVPD